MEVVIMLRLPALLLAREAATSAQRRQVMSTVMERKTLRRLVLDLSFHENNPRLYEWTFDAGKTGLGWGGTDCTNGVLRKEKTGYIPWYTG